MQLILKQSRDFTIGLMLFISCVATLSAETIGRMFLPVSNNAVAAAKTAQGWQLYSFNGLKADKDRLAITNLAQGFDLQSKRSYQLESVPYAEGRLASIAVNVKNKIYLFGGYSVDEKHVEKSMSEVYQFDPINNQFKLFSHMPIPVDDSVALVYQQRYVYLISGWHDVGNVADVQVLDTENGKWYLATPFPGIPVFGHAAGMLDNQLVVIDGVKVSSVVSGKRQFDMAAQSYLGEIDENDFTQISWQKLPKHPGLAGYRMAATSYNASSGIIFSGGSHNPYNYDGIGYNGVASEPLSQLFIFKLKNKQWQLLELKSTATMDHRGLVVIDKDLYTLGGMLAGQKVTDKIIRVDF